MPLSTDLEVTCLIASQRMVETEAIDNVREQFGDDAAHWFAQGVGFEWATERAFQQKIREVTKG